MTVLNGIFNVDNRKKVSKFSGLKWFLLFKDFTMETDHYKQKLAKTIDFKLKIVRNKGTSNLQAISLILIFQKEKPQ